MTVPVEQKIRYFKKSLLKFDINRYDEFQVKVGQKIYFDDKFIQRDNYKDKIIVSIPIKYKKYENNLKVVHGEIVSKDDLLASFPAGIMGLGLEDIFSPARGIIDLSDIAKRKIYIKSINEEKFLLDGINGSIRKIVPKSYAEVSSDFVRIIPASIISNSEIIGNIESVKFKTDRSIAKYILPEHKGKILFIDTIVSPDAFIKADVIGVEAIICAGIDVDQFEVEFGSYDLSKLRNKLKIAVVILEGFGKFESYAKVSSIISKNSGMFGVIRKDSFDLCVKSIPAKASTQIKYFDNLKVGDEVRIYREENFGEYGKVTSLKEKEELVDVTLDNEKRLNQVSIYNIVKIL
jgi:hypothetical protein